MHVPPETTHVCEIQATKGGDNFHIYIVCLLLYEHLFHLIQTQWVSYSYFSFPDSILRLVCELSLIQLIYCVWSYPK